MMSRMVLELKKTCRCCREVNGWVDEVGVRVGGWIGMPGLEPQNTCTSIGGGILFVGWVEVGGCETLHWG